MDWDEQGTMKKNSLPVITLLLCSLISSLARGATDWSTQDYDLYPGDFNGDGKTDILYVAKDASKVSGIALSDGAGPNIPYQSWPSNYLGIPWYGNHYNVIIGDFNGDGYTDLFLQSTSTTGLNAVVLTDSTGTYQGIINLTATAPWKTWTDNFLGYRWSTAEAKLYIGDFNGDGLSDLVGAHPTIANNAIQFRHFPVGDGVLTLGNVSIYGPGWTPHSSCDCYGNGDTNTAAHEREHTYQYQALGPLFLPVYFLFGGGIQSGNFMENDADHYSLGSTDWFRNAPTH
jgi:hypothetical protein